MPGNVCQGVTSKGDVMEKWFTVAYAYPEGFGSGLRYETEPHDNCLAAWKRFASLCSDHRVVRVGIMTVKDGVTDVRMIRERKDSRDIGAVVQHFADMPGVHAALLGCEPGEVVPAGEQLTMGDVSEAVTYELRGG